MSQPTELSTGSCSTAAALYREAMGWCEGTPSKFDAQGAWLGGGRDDAFDHDVNDVDTFRQSLLIRFGREADVSTAFVEGADAMLSLLATIRGAMAGRRDADARASAQGDLEKARRAEERFLDAAHKLAGSAVSSLPAIRS